MKALGYFFRNCFQLTFEPYFVLEEIEIPAHEALRLPIGETVIKDMCMRGIFNMGILHVLVSKELSTTIISLCLQHPANQASGNTFLPISGFPRKLMVEDNHVRGEHSHPRACRNEQAQASSHVAL